MKVSLIVYTLNEIGGMRAMMPRIKREWYDEIFVIDGGSTDGTIEYAREHGYPVYLQEEWGWGGAYMEAYRRATGDLLVDFSPDGNSIPELIPALVNKAQEGYDLVLASRYFDGARSEDDTPITRFGNWMFTSMINGLFETRYTDALVVFRAYRRRLLEKGGLLQCDLDQSVTGLLSIRCAKIKAKFAEIAGHEPKRIAGDRKMNIWLDGLRNLAIILKEFAFHNIQDAKKVRIGW